MGFMKSSLRHGSCPNHADKTHPSKSLQTFNLQPKYETAHLQMAWYDSLAKAKEVLAMQIVIGAIGVLTIAILGYLL